MDDTKANKGKGISVEHPNAWDKKSKKIFQNVTNGGKLHFVKPNPSLCMKVNLDNVRFSICIYVL